MGSRYTDKYGLRVEQILCSPIRVIQDQLPDNERSELMAAVNEGVLGRLEKNGYYPEVFFHPDHKNGAIDRQKLYAGDAFGPNVTMILNEGVRVITKIPGDIRRKQLMPAVKAGVLGHLRRNGLKPEIFFHPDHRSRAIDIQIDIATKSINAISKIIAPDSNEELCNKIDCRINREIEITD
jgi:hypothetical protein